VRTVGLRALGEKREEALERRAEHVVLEVRLRSAGLPIEELPGPPIFSPGMSIQERSDNAMRLVWAGILGEKTGPPKRDPETMAALFRMVEGGMATDEAPPGILQWDFPDADPWHLVVANGESRVEPGRTPDVTATLRLRYEDWVDLVAGRVDARKLALRGRVRPKGDLRWLWQARGMFP
jgi:SCP-2 sterol transfer family